MTKNQHNARRKKGLGLFQCSLALGLLSLPLTLPATGEAKAAEQSAVTATAVAKAPWSRVKFVPLAGARSETLVRTLYSGFFKAHPDASLEVAEIDLDLTPSRRVASLAVRFNSQATCRDGDSCTTNILWHNGKSWQEVWSKHTRVLWLGPVSPANEGGGYMREVSGDDKLVWRWINYRSYYPDLRSIAPLWPQPKPASPELAAFVKSLNADDPDFHIGADDTILAIPVNFGLMTGFIAIYQSIALCGQIGCPFVVVTGSPGHFQSNGRGFYDGLGGMLPATDGDGWRRFAVQQNNGLLFYHYDRGAFTPYASTFPYPHLPAP